MAANRISFSQCAAFFGLAEKELVLGVTPSAKHDQLYSSYLLNLRSSPNAVCQMIVADIRAYIDLGAMAPAADLLIVLRRFLSEWPDAASGACCLRAGANSTPSCPRRKKNNRHSRLSSAPRTASSRPCAAGVAPKRDNILLLKDYRPRFAAAAPSV
jgi:hypothetical protein